MKKAKLLWLLNVPDQGFKIIICEIGIDTKYSFDLGLDFYTANEIGQLMGGN